MLHLCRFVVHELVLRHHDGHVMRELEHRRCIYAVRGLVLHLYMFVVRGLVRRPDESDLALRLYRYEVLVLVLHRCTCAERELGLHHHDVRVVDELVLHLYMYVVRGLDDRLRSDLLSLLVFRRPCAVVCQKDSKRRYCALRRALQRVEIPRGYAHLGREEFEVREIRPLPPWYLAWRASWQQ